MASPRQEDRTPSHATRGALQALVPEKLGPRLSFSNPENIHACDSDYFTPSDWPRFGTGAAGQLLNDRPYKLPACQRCVIAILEALSKRGLAK